MKRITQILTAFLITVSTASMLVVAAPQPARAACNEYLLTFPTWYRGLVSTSTCEIMQPARTESGLSDFIWKIALNVVDMIMQLVGYTSLVFLIIGGFRYITATGEPEKMTASKKTITNAIIGLIIALASVAIVNAIARAI